MCSPWVLYVASHCSSSVFHQSLSNGSFRLSEHNMQSSLHTTFLVVHFPSSPAKHARHGPQPRHSVGTNAVRVRRDFRVGPLLCTRNTSRLDLLIALVTLCVVASAT